MTKKKNGGTKADNIVKGKAKAKANGKFSAKGYGKKFTGDFGDATPIRARGSHPKILALKTYGGLREFLKKELGQGKSFEEVGKELQVSGSRVSEFVNILGIERPKKGTGEICEDRPTIGPDGEFRMEAPRETKGKGKTKKLPNGDILEAVNGHAQKAMKG